MSKRSCMDLLRSCYDFPPASRQQADSLVQLLEQLQTVGTIRITRDAACGPHGIARIDVLDPDAFRRWPLLRTPTI